MSGQTVLVTGSTNGLDREAALAQGRLGAEAIVHGRDEGGESAVEAVRSLASLALSSSASNPGVVLHRCGARCVRAVAARRVSGLAGI